MKLKHVFVITCFLFMELTVTGCSEREPESVIYLPTPTIEIKASPIPQPTVTIAPIQEQVSEAISDTETPYSTIAESGAFPKQDDYGDLFEKFNPYEKWIISDDGIKSRIDYYKTYFDISEEYAIYLMAAYYDWNNSALEIVNYDYDSEVEWVDTWIMYMSDRGYIPEEDYIKYIVDTYLAGECIDLENFAGWGYEGYISFHLEVESETGDIHNTEMYWEAQLADNEASNEALLPISSNGEELKFGDKVKVTGGFSVYGGTVYEINGSQVRVKWEVKGDAMFFIDWDEISDSEKSNPLSPSFGLPSDSELIDASTLTKISYLSW